MWTSTIRTKEDIPKLHNEISQLRNQHPCRPPFDSVRDALVVPIQRTSRCRASCSWCAATIDRLIARARGRRRLEKRIGPVSPALTALAAFRIPSDLPHLDRCSPG